MLSASQCQFIIGVSFVLMLACLAPAKANEKSAAVQLYLPITATQFPGLLERFEDALEAAQLDWLEISTAEYWSSYHNAIRTGRHGVYFTAPHFLAWAQQEHNFVPLVRLAEPLRYVIASQRKDADIFEISDLDRQKVCSQAPLNLDYLLVNSSFDNRLHAAQIQQVSSVLVEMIKPISECVAYSISEHRFLQIEQQSPSKYIRLQQSRQYNNFGFVSHPRVSKRKRAQLLNFLLSSASQTALTPMLLEYANTAKLVVASARDYPSSYAQPLRPYWR